MSKKFHIALAAIGVLAVVAVAVVTQGRFYKGDSSSPLSVQCAGVEDKPLSVTGRRERLPASGPCAPLNRYEREINRHIPPNVPVERPNYDKVRAPQLNPAQINVKVRGK